MRPHLRRCLVLAALGGVSVLASGAAQAAPRTTEVLRPADGGAASGHRPFGGQFDPVVGHGGGVVSGGGQLLVSRAGGA
ncbi:hypothetical protein HEK616_68350 [Streptomyces nigrescens]|uniref:Uncharacterized protein n=2 Tax=Streptomyces TaxID=1883 RepID=A0ABM8A428_STRNI|nr:hypothetical protein [Streptomyces nigrescens]MEE4420888.1 hypothetical protein [Streptomyces sp. DSM 41528]BDM73348.1 hypothetical protein HEK616_68350 [Streptomyces nigrescens]